MDKQGGPAIKQGLEHPVVFAGGVVAKLFLAVAMAMLNARVVLRVKVFEVGALKSLRAQLRSQQCRTRLLTRDIEV